MDYSLAKELKDAGFPQDGYKECPVCEDDDCCCLEWDAHKPLLVAMPSLSELIEVCGENFSLLQGGFPGKWRVQGLSVGDKVLLDVEGATPEEAVGRLWLALNKK